MTHPNEPVEPGSTPLDPTNAPVEPGHRPESEPAPPANLGHPDFQPPAYPPAPESSTPGTGPGPESEPAPPAERRTERPHPLTPLARGWILFVGMAIWIGREFLPDGSGQPRELPPLQVIAGGVGVFVVAVALISVAGWWFTRFIIDDQEFRYETGALFRSSKVVPFERIQTVDITQPLLARIFGLAELRIDAGTESMVLRYLTRTRAYRFRDYLMARATGQQITTAESAQSPVSDWMTDVGGHDEMLVQVNPRWIVIAFLLSGQFISSVAFVIVALILVFVIGWWWLIFPLLVPSALALATMIPKRVLNQFNYTLSRTRTRHHRKSLRVSRGLTALVSQSVPTDRIQGIKLSQSLLWRHWDLWQVDVEVLGQKAGQSDDNSQDIGSQLLPPAPPAEVRTALAAVWPHVDIDQIELHEVPKRVRWLRPFTHRKLRWGWDDNVVITHKGRWSRVIEVVPHAKTQSVSIRQGPLQRRLQLATVSVDTTPGPVNAVADHLDPEDARSFATAQLDRARLARSNDAQH